MNAKVIIALILGLVFQLAQVLPGAVVASSCPSHTESCGCCKSGKSCQCAENSDSNQKPNPAPIETAAGLKLPHARISETGIMPVTAAGIESVSRTTTFFHTGPPSGFPGVRLSVAFCTFVI